MKIIAITYLKQLNLFDDKSKITSYIPYNQIARFDLINNNHIDIVLNDKNTFTLDGLSGQEELEALLEYIHTSNDTIVYIYKFIEDYKSREDSSSEEEDGTEEHTRNRFHVIDD